MTNEVHLVIITIKNFNNNQTAICTEIEFFLHITTYKDQIIPSIISVHTDKALKLEHNNNNNNKANNIALISLKKKKEEREMGFFPYLQEGNFQAVKMLGKRGWEYRQYILALRAKIRNISYFLAYRKEKKNFLNY